MAGPSWCLSMNCIAVGDNHKLFPSSIKGVRMGGDRTCDDMNLKRLLAIILIAAAACLSPTCSFGAADAKKAKPYDTSGWVGANYTPAYCVNQVQMWHEFKPDVIERELAAAKKYFGLTTLRVFLHNLVYDAEADKLLERMDKFLSICERHGIRPGFVFFDDCHRREGIVLEPQKPPIDGYHNGRWAACPQNRHRKDQNMPKFKAYVQGVVRRFAKDKRVRWWEIYNEPNRSAFSQNLRKKGYAWAKELKPIQPVLCCWNDSKETDIVDAHNYGQDFRAWDRQADQNPAKGAFFTEAGARWYYTKGRSNGTPTEVIAWLRGRKAAGKTAPGVCLTWELMVGNSHCRWYWGTKHGTPEPPVPWCGLLWPDGTPVSLAEAEAVRSYVTGKSRAMLFQDFQSRAGAKSAAPPGWKAYGATAGGACYLPLSPGVKMVAGKTDWGDYVLEAAVMLRGDRGDAGLIFRVNNPGAGRDQMRGYYAGFNTKKLYLGRMNNDWRELAGFDLTKLPSAPKANGWSLLRIAVEGRRIRVWLNAMHDDTGLRIDYKDSSKDAVLTGAVGVRTNNIAAWFDDVVVLPIGDLPKLKPSGNPVGAAEIKASSGK